MNRVKEKAKNKRNSSKISKQIYNPSPILQNEEVRQYLKDLQTKCCIVPIDKASKKIYINCKKLALSCYMKLGGVVHKGILINL